MTEALLQRDAETPAQSRAAELRRFATVVVASIAVLVLLGGTLLGTPEARTTVLAACAWFTAHLVVIFAWLARARPHEPVLRSYLLVSTLWTAVLLCWLARVWLAKGDGASETLELLADFAALWFLCASFDMVLRAADSRPAWAVRGLLALGALSLTLPLAMLIDLDLAGQVSAGLRLLLRLVGIAVVLVLVRALLRGPDQELRILLGAGLVIMAVALEQPWVALFPDAEFRHLVTPVLGAAMALLLVHRLLEATRSAEGLAANLERTVEERTRQLEQRHGEIRVLERRQALQDERERIMRDMHDGAGGQLVSLLALLEGSDRRDDEELRRRLSMTLLDLRLMIDSLDELDGDITGLVADFRMRMQPVLDAAGVSSRWRIDALPLLQDLGPRAALDVLRILQEALTNTLRHARARSVEVRARTISEGVVIEIEDDGVGLEPASGGGGRGLSNMRARAERLGGTLEVSGSAAGTRIALRLPAPGRDVERGRSVPGVSE